MTNSNRQKVIVIRTPNIIKNNDTTGQQKFLGYKWSDAKGNEGIKYLNVRVKSEEDDDTMQQLKGIDGILTPLFNPKNIYDSEKINALIRENYLNGFVSNIPDSLREYVSLFNLTDMLDFNRVKFDKIINRIIKNNSSTVIQSAYPMESIGKYLFENAKSNIQVNSAKDVINGEYPFFTSGENVYSYNEYLVDGENIYLSTGGNAVVKYYKGKAAYSTDTYVVKSDNENSVLTKYLFIILENIRDYINQYHFKGVGLKHLQKGDLKSEKIPIPSLDVQKSIVADYEKVDAEYDSSIKTIEECKRRIVEIVANVKGPIKSLKDVCEDINPSKTTISSVPNETIVSFVDMQSVSNEGFIEVKTDRPLGELRKGGYTYFAENDIIIAKITPCMENGKCAIASGLTNGIGMGSSEFHVFRIKPEHSNKYVFAYLNRNVIREQAAKVMTGASGHRRVPITFYEGLQIPVPPIAEQQRIVSEIETCEAEIAKAKAVMAGCAERKKHVLDKWLK